MKISNLSNQPQKIMAIDASTNSLAFSIFDGKELKGFGKINFEGSVTYSKVIDACRKTSEFLKLYRVDAIVIEHTVFMNSPKVAADLALVQGALLGAAGLCGIRMIRSVAPITWQNFIGNKKLSKDEKFALKKQYPDKSDSWLKNHERTLRKLKTIKFIDIEYNRQVDDNDVADAIGIGHYAVNNWERLTK
jgi:Holliday junction resolvasome RuvABC endonuclease subunit